MLGRGIFRKKQASASEPDTEALQNIFQLVDNSNIPLGGNALFRVAKMDATDIEECLQALVSQEKIEVAYEKKGLDGISRSYYRVSEKYNLLDAKKKISKFITSVIQKAKPFVDNGHHYYVKVLTRKEFDMVFDVRQHARDYKRLLRDSRMKLNSEIWEQIFDAGVQVEERKVS